MLTCQRALFSLPKNIHYLNCAYMSPLMNSVVEVGIKAVQRKAYPWKIFAKDFFEEVNQCKQLFLQLISTQFSENEYQNVSIIPSTSYGISTLVKNVEQFLSPNNNIVILHEQFPSNVYPWMKLQKKMGVTIKYVKPINEFNRGQKWNEEILNQIDENTKIVSIPHCHWIDGTIFDLQAIGEKCKKVGAFLFIDGTQSIGAFPFDISKYKPDAVVCAGYKTLMGPYSIGFAYYSKDFLDQLDNGGEPLEENWINRKESYNFPKIVDYQEEYEPGASRFDVGEKSNFILLPMMKEALLKLNEFTPQRIQAYCEKITEETIHNLQSFGFQVEDKSYRASHLFGIRLPSDVDAVELSKKLQEENVFVSVKGNTIRVSPNIYNDENDLRALERSLISATKKNGL